MRFDVGQRIHTPLGAAMVKDVVPPYVRTDRGTFKIENVMSERDHEILKDPANVVPWLEGEFDEAEDDRDVELVDTICTCECNSREKRCHRIFHVDEHGEVLFQSGHQLISTDCRCEQKGCECLT
jgi:hypothetical protein